MPHNDDEVFGFHTTDKDFTRRRGVNESGEAPRGRGSYQPQMDDGRIKTMRFCSQSLGLSGNAFFILRDLIHERTGLFYENGKRELLAEKLSGLVQAKGLHSFLDYYYLLKYDQDQQYEWHKLIDTLSVQETYFWRERDQFLALVEGLAVEHFAQNPFQPLRIWSAACATGEEPLSIAMALEEAGWFAKMPIEIYASDISPSAISKARAGKYRERSLRNLPIELQTKYFIQEDDDMWRIDPHIHARIRWNVANVLEEKDLDFLPRVSVIFCRNMFIYFSQQAIRRTLENFYRRLTSPGYLCIGASESLLNLTTDFELQEIAGAFIYVKG